MKSLIVALVAMTLMGCASGPYDAQFCTESGPKGCKAWTIGPGFGQTPVSKLSAWGTK